LDSIANELKTIYGQKRKREREEIKTDKERINEEKKEK
jgi:hypothetical protein